MHFTADTTILELLYERFKQKKEKAKEILSYTLDVENLMFIVKNQVSLETNLGSVKVEL